MANIFVDLFATVFVVLFETRNFLLLQIVFRRNNIYRGIFYIRENS